MSTDKLNELVEAAMARYHAMTPGERSAMWAAQRRSWVIGEMMIEHPEMSREEAERICDAAFAAL